MNLRSLIVVHIILVISGCTGVKETAFVELPLPPEISEENTLTQDELKCITDKTLDKIILIDKRRETLRNIILSTHND